MKPSDKIKRFNTLLDNYAVAVYVADSLLDSGLMESKIKINDYGLYRKNLVAIIAGEIRQGEKSKSNQYIEEGVLLADAYFAELSYRGEGWEYADLEDLFFEYRERQIELNNVDPI